MSEMQIPVGNLFIMTKNEAKRVFALNSCLSKKRKWKITNLSWLLKLTNTAAKI